MKALIAIPVLLLVWACPSRVPPVEYASTYARLGVKNRPPEDSMKGWLFTVREFWGQHYPQEQVDRCLDSWLFGFSDEEKLPFGTRGYTECLQGGSVIGYRETPEGKPDWRYVGALVRHEAAHAVLCCTGVSPWHTVLQSDCRDKAGNKLKANLHHHVMCQKDFPSK